MSPVTGTNQGWRWLVLATALVAGAALVMSPFLYLRTSVALDRGSKAAAALCVLRADLQNRVGAGEQFLKDHPKGIGGIPAATIKQSLDGQRRTVHALSALKCP